MRPPPGPPPEPQCGAGLLVWGMTETTQLVHEVLFNIGRNERLSAMVELNPFRTVLVPAFGGLVLGLTGLVIAMWRQRRAVDPIEANALYGGGQWLDCSLVGVERTIMSNVVRG